MEGQSQPGHTVRTIAGDPICTTCIPQVLAQFEEALKSEINFPPKWGPEEISFESFEDLFTDDFRSAYREKVKEYTTPIPKRVYCQHKVPITSQDKTASQTETDFCNTFMGAQAGGFSQCAGCTNWMCMECRETALAPPAIHTCDATRAAAKSDNESEAWKNCPNPDCQIKCDLKEGCNAITCACGTCFCFICGEETGHDSDHWMEGKPCPRWGTVDAPNPMFDRPAIVARPGHPLIIAQDAQGVPNMQRFDILWAANDRLYMDSEESLTLLEELASEQFWMEDGEGNIHPTILEMMRLLRLWKDNFNWLKIDSALAGALQVRDQLVDPLDQAIETTNFFIRDEALQAKLRETHAAALVISKEDSVLFTVPVMEVFERYTTVHKPRLVEHLQQFVAARDAGRVLHVREEEQFARRMLRRFAREENEEEDLPHRRRASI